MEKKRHFTGRFLASRVYVRWKWPARFGLFVIPLVLFLSGSVTYYFTPKQQQSSTTFEYLGERSPAEVMKLLTSSSIFDPAYKAAWKSANKDDYAESSAEMISRVVEATVDSETGWITLRATTNRAQVSRDLAAGLVDALEKYEKAIHTSHLKELAESLQAAMVDAEDAASEKKQHLVKLIAGLAKSDSDPVARIVVAEARKEWDHAYSRFLDSRGKWEEATGQLSTPRRWTQVHTSAVISHQAVKQDISWQEVIWVALGSGLASALLVPYLLELAFPRRIRRAGKCKSAWAEEADESGFSVLISGR